MNRNNNRLVPEGDAMSKPLFTVVPKSELDTIPAQQLEAIFNTEANIKVYKQMLRKAMSDFINYGKLPDKQKEQLNE